MSVASAFSRAASQSQQVTVNVGGPVRRGWVDDRAFSPLLSLMVWTLVVLMIVPEGFDYSALSTDAMPSSGGGVSRFLWLALLGSGWIVVIWRSSLAWLLGSRLNWFFLLFLVAATASVTWSIAPSVTIRRLIRVYTIVGVAAASMLVAWHERRFQQLIRPILTVMMAGSIVFAFAYPKYGIHQESSYELVGAWRGLTNHKNTLGALSSITAIFWFHAWLTREVSWRRSTMGCGIAFVTLLASRSSTALVTTLFVFGQMTLLLRSPPNLRRWMPIIVSVFVATLLVYALAILRLVPGLEILLKPIAMITGKDLTFTGRSQIWALMVEHIRHSPLLGTGFGGYWTGPTPGGPSYIFVQKLYFYPGSAHNGYLEIINDLGTVGGICLAGYLGMHVVQALKLFRIDRRQATLFLALFFQQAISNLSETHWLSVLNCDFVVITTASFALARALLQLHLSRYFGHPLAGASAVAGAPESSSPPPLRLA